MRGQIFFDSVPEIMKESQAHVTFIINFLLFQFFASKIEQRPLEVLIIRAAKFYKHVFYKTSIRYIKTGTFTLSDLTHFWTNNFSSN